MSASGPGGTTPGEGAEAAVEAAGPAIGSEEAHPGSPGRMARLHLQAGLLRLARVELEELAGEGRLGAEDVLDLAEARWRTGDLRGAAEAAGAWLEADAEDADTEVAPRSLALANALIADGLTARGRHDDAALHVAASLDALEVGLVRPGAATDPSGSVAAALDALFAGIVPRADAWPSFEPGDGGDGPPVATSTGVALSRSPARVPDPAEPDPVAAADERLAAGDDVAAAVLFLLALRATPGRGDEVLARVDAALSARSSAALLLARAEALRTIGRHEAAGIAYAVADTHARGGPEAAAPTPDPDAAAAPDLERSPE